MYIGVTVARAGESLCASGDEKNRLKEKISFPVLKRIPHVRVSLRDFQSI